MSEKYIMTWEDFYTRLKELQDYWNNTLSYFINPNHINVYGIPKSGWIVASLCKGWHLVDRPELATIIIDDVSTTNFTRLKYENKYKLDKNTYVPVVVLIDKFNNEKHRDLGWVVFPFDKQNDINENYVRILEHHGIDLTDQNIEQAKSYFNNFNIDDR
jgi:hypothetical protein